MIFGRKGIKAEIVHQSLEEIKKNYPDVEIDVLTSGIHTTAKSRAIEFDIFENINKLVIGDDDFNKIINLSYDELNESIEKLETYLYYNEPGTEEFIQKTHQLNVVKQELKKKKQSLHEQIIKDVTDPDTMSKEAAGYDNYRSFLSDSEMGNHGYEEVLYEDFTENDLEKLWKESH